jgi:hypothetical protein
VDIVRHSVLVCDPMQVVARVVGGRCQAQCA